MEEKELKLYEKLNFYNWYKDMLSHFTCVEDEILRKHSRKEVELILKDLGYCYTYHSSSKIYNVSTKFGGVTYYCNPEIKDGLVRVYLYAESDDLGKQIGGNLISICRLIEMAKGEDTGEYLLLPRFRDHRELALILGIVFKKYEEFKPAVHDSGLLMQSHDA